jgi:uncharacterized iron-regulated membrane protein
MDNARQWAFVADMNYDGAVTISDVWLWVKWLYFYPGDLFLAGLMSGFPGVARFFEITSGSYGGFFSGVLAAIVWLVACFLVPLISVLDAWMFEHAPAQDVDKMRRDRGYDE